MACTREAVLTLYRNLIRESKKWKSYNYRMYAVRKIQYEFQKNKNLQDKERMEECYKGGREALELIKRQVVIGHLYVNRPLVIETTKKTMSIAN